MAKNILYLSGINNTKKYGLYWAVYNRMKVLKKYSKNNIYFLTVPIVDTLFIRLLKYFFNVTVNYPPEKDKPFFETIELKKGLLDYIIGLFNKKYFDKKLYKVVLEYCQKNNIDFIHVHWAYPYGYVVSEIAKNCNIPYVLNIHGSDIIIHPFRNKNIMRNTIQALNLAVKIYSVSDELSKKAKKLIGLNNLNFETTGNGVNIPAVKNTNLDKKLHVLFIGALEFVKGADRLIEIFKLISLKIPNIKLSIIGMGKYFNYLKREKDKNNLNIDLLGYKENKDVEKIKLSSDLIIVPSRAEGFSLAVLESYASNIPVIATNVGGMKKLVLDKELLIEDNDDFVVNFSNKIIEYYLRRYDYYSERRKQEVYLQYAKQFSWDKIVKKEGEYYLK